MFPGELEGVFQQLLDSGLAEKLKFNEGNIIYHKGEKTDRIYYLSRGRVKFSMFSKEGREKIITILHPGNFFGEVGYFSDQPFMFTAVALEKTEVVISDTINVLEDPRATLVLLREMSQKLYLVQIHLENEAFCSAETKIARILLLMTNENHEIQITQEELATIANVSRVTVNKIINDFCNRGIISISRKKILVINRVLLNLCANFD